jgi:hypothetical protein
MKAPFYSVIASGSTVSENAYKQDALAVSARFADVSVVRTGRNGQTKEVYNHYHEGADDHGVKTVSGLKAAKKQNRF